MQQLFKFFLFYNFIFLQLSCNFYLNNAENFDTFWKLSSAEERHLEIFENDDKSEEKLKSFSNEEEEEL
jgi:hypothetical protein